MTEKSNREAGLCFSTALNTLRGCQVQVKIAYEEKMKKVTTKLKKAINDRRKMIEDIQKEAEGSRRAALAALRIQQEY